MQGTLGPGTILLGKYRVESMLGFGGMGVVLRVTHLHLNEELALKILSPEAAATPDIHARFLREAQAAVRLRGEHVARVSDVGVLPDGTPYMVMEYLRGLDLADELKRRTMLHPREVVDYVLQACEALAEAHAHGIVHRDIKPANLFLTTRPDGTPLVKVLDFGISKAPVSASDRLTRTETVMGTPGYMSPEQMKAAKDVDARADIWSLGIVLYECLCGRRPFEAESFSAIVLLAGTEPPPPMDPRIPRGLQGVVLRCLEKDRRARFSSIAELAAALAPFARDQRAAHVIVDRTRLMQQGARAAIAIADHATQSPTATTLSGSAGSRRSRSRRRRYLLAGVMSVIGSITILPAAITSSTGHSRNASDGSAASTGSNNAGVQNRLAAPDIPMDASAPPPIITPIITTLDAAAISTTADDIDADKRTRKLAECSELATRKEWAKVDECASELDAIGVTGKAKEFHAVAREERRHALDARKFQQALQEQNLKEAAALLREIGAESVYFKPLSDAFTKAETSMIEEVKHKAQAFVSTHDCANFKRLVAQQIAGSTNRVATFIQEMKCTEKIQPANAITSKTSINNYREDQQPSRDPTAISRSRSAPAITTPVYDHHEIIPEREPCKGIKVEDVITQAQNQYTNGYAEPALEMMRKALTCEQNIKMYRLAATYACAAHDLASAKLYFTKLPADYRAAIEQKCQQGGLNLNPQNNCGTMNPEDAMNQATKHHNAGDDKLALTTINKALACKQTTLMYRLATIYACGAHDLANAKLYFGKVPSGYQAELEQQCEQAGLNVRSP